MIETTAVTAATLAAAFTEWDRRFREDPERFESEATRLLKSTPESYGEACAPYLLAILAEQANDRPACPRCEGCGQLANDDQRTPWTFWAALKPPSNLAVQIGMVRPVPCHECHGTGKTVSA